MASTDVADRVAQAWEKVHEKLEDPSARVPRQAFVDYCLSTVPEDSPKLEEFTKYLNTLFDTATGLMLPSEKTDLGKHCFGYASILANEFYFDEPADALSLKADEKPSDRLAEVRQKMDADWEAVEKDDDGRVIMEAFIAYFMKKHGEQATDETKDSYKAFLEKDFNSSVAMMLPEEKTSLGGHCFRYASIMAGEFYFSSDNPVADILQVAQSKPEAKEEDKEVEEAPVEKAEEAPVEKAEEAPVEKAEEAPVEKAEEAPVEKAVEEEKKPEPKPAGGAATYSLVELQDGCPEGVTPTQKEDFLNDADFEAALKMSRADFGKLPKWKKDQAKKASKIF